MINPKTEYDISTVQALQELDNIRTEAAKALIEGRPFIVSLTFQNEEGTHYANGILSQKTDADIVKHHLAKTVSKLLPPIIASQILAKQ